MSMEVSAEIMFNTTIIMVAGVIGFFIFLMLMAFFKGNKTNKEAEKKND